MSGLGNSIDVPISLLNQNAGNFFTNKVYTESISRVAIIFVTQNLSEEEVNRYKTKYVKQDDKVGINVYLDYRPFINQDLQSILGYISRITINTLEKNKRLYKLFGNYELLLIDLKMFFDQVLDKSFVQQQLSETKATGHTPN